MFLGKSDNPFSLIMDVAIKTSLRHLDKVDTGAAITLSKTRKANQSYFTITQSRNIQIHVFETSLI